MQISSFISDFENLPKHIQEQVLDYIEFLVSKYKSKDQKDKEFKLDFDDSYQTCIAIDRNLEIVTMDKDFNKVSKIHKIRFI